MRGSSLWMSLQNRAFCTDFHEKTKAKSCVDVPGISTAYISYTTKMQIAECLPSFSVELRIRALERCSHLTLSSCVTQTVDKTIPCLLRCRSEKGKHVEGCRTYLKICVGDTIVLALFISSCNFQTSFCLQKPDHRSSMKMKGDFKSSPFNINF